ncbi:hypothetical protein MK851_14110 [Tenacibaculum sp. 1B UA]|uniref:hypothetical protein n=1 Tax=Tenacibaculum sp. 1B UA TaxID=2922252 RepID=UPI002A24832B|nr:hypothetical protein [Tenacibaculum sp. 1B UA]MDX8554751.1 hypothetical protein [Tenacibaculum sp. 1B UA]
MKNKRKKIKLKTKFVIIILTLAFHNVKSQTSNSIGYNQWHEINFVDEFGNETDKKGKRYYTTGKFSNSATNNSDLTIRITDYKKYFHFSLFEYNRKPGVIFRSGSYNFVLVSIQDRYGTIIRKGVPILKSGGINIRKKSKLGKIIKKNEPIKIHISEASEYGNNSTYLFKLFY